MSQDYIIPTPKAEAIAHKQGFYNAFIAKFPLVKTIQPHFHPEIEIIIPIGVEGEAIISGKTYRLHDNQVYCMAPSTMHAFKIVPARTISTVHILQINLDATMEYLPEFFHGSIPFSETFRRIPVIIGTTQREILHKTVTSLFGSSEKSITRNGLLPLSLLESFFGLLRILAESAISDKPVFDISSRVRDIINFTEKHSGEKLSLDWIARETAISKTHLCRVFKS